MRAAPALQVDVLRFGWWRATVAFCVLATLALNGVWLLSMAATLTLAALVACGAAAVICVAAAASLLNPRAFRLRFEGSGWQVSGLGAGSQVCAGQVGACVDMGFWMLLRFRADMPRPRCRHRWLPVQRQGLQTQWHALRCAVYSARPETAASARVESHE